jgi:hypothetical protein
MRSDADNSPAIDASGFASAMRLIRRYRCLVGVYRVLILADAK